MTHDAGNTETPKRLLIRERLEVRKGLFTIENPVSPKILKHLERSAYWKKSGNTYTTDSLGAAVVFRKYADDRTEKIFQRRFQAHYEVPELPELPLDPHQIDGVKWVLGRKRSYLAHAPGAGKTAESIVAALLAPGGGPTLFIVPPTLVVNWEKEIWKFTEWFGLFPAIGIIGKSDSQDTVAWRGDFVICPDSMITKTWVYDRLAKTPWKFIGVDEASRMKESTSERSVAFYGGTSIREDGNHRNFTGLFQDARHVVFLDGSPMPNRPMELWAPTFALHPEAIECMSQNDFGYRYCGARPNDRGVWEFLHSSNEGELKTRLQKDFMHVVSEHELSHPERRRALVFMSEDVRSGEQKTWERRHLSGITDISEDASRGEFATFRRELGIRKVPWVTQYVRERLKYKNESILLFAWHREVCETLAENLSKWNPVCIIGGVSSTTREHAFDLFQRGILRLLILNIMAGGRGHNLQRADRAVFAEWSWTDENNKQCEKRGSRRGSEKDFLRCDYIVAPHSMDERMLSSVFTKEKRVEKVIG